MNSKTQIEELKKTIEGLQKNEEKYKEFYENSPFSYQSLNENGEFLDVNSRWLSTLGYEKEKVIGKNFRDFLHPNSQPYFDKNFPAFKKRGYASDIEYKIRHKKGHFIDIILNGHAGLNPDGSYKQSFCVFKDISAQKKAENKLHEIQERYKLLYESAGVGVGYYTVDGTVIDFNEKALAHLVLKREDVIGKHLTELFPEPHAKEYLKRINSTLKSNSLIFEDEVELPGGNKHFLSNYSVVKDQKGKIIGVQIMSTDITRQKENERKYLELIENFKVSQRLGNIGSWDWNVETGAAIWSDQLYSIYGRDPELGPPPLDSYHEAIHPDDREKLADAIQKSLEKGGYEIEFRLLRYNDGEIRHIFAKGEVLYNKEGNPVRHFGTAMDITQKKKVEEELLKSEETYRLLAENAQDVIFMHDMEGKIQYVNPFGMQFTNRSYEEVIGSNIDEFLDMGDVSNRREAMQRIIEGKEKKHVSEMKYEIPGGPTLYLEINANPVFKEGIPIAILIIARDITGRKMAEKALAESESKYRLLAENAKHIIIVHDLEGKLKYMNTYGLKLFNLDEQNYIGLSIDRFLTEEEVKERQEITERMISGEKEKHVSEFIFTTNKGDKKYLENTGVLLYENEEPVAFMLVIRDVTEWKNALQALEKSEEKYRMLADNASDVIWVYNWTKQKFSYISPSVKQLRGYTVEEAIQQKLEDSLTEKSVDEIKARVPEIMKEFSNDPDSDKLYYFQLEQPCKDGTTVWVEVSTKYGFNKHDEIEVMGISRDITERKKAEEALKESEAKNKAILRAIPDLLFVQDRKGVFLDYYAESEEILYTQPEKFIGKDMYEVFLKEFASKMMNEIDKAFETKQLNVVEYELSLTKEPRYFEARIIPFDKERMINIIREITDRKLAEDELKKHRDNLEEMIKERTKEIEEKNKELERFNNLFVGREFRIKELRDEVKRLNKLLDEKQT